MCNCLVTPIKTQIRSVKVTLVNHWSSVMSSPITEASFNLYPTFNCNPVIEKSVQFSWSGRIIQNKETRTGVAPAAVITRYHWSDRREGPGSGPRTSSGRGHRPEFLREKQTFMNQQQLHSFSLNNQRHQLHSSRPERLNEDSWRSRTPWCTRGQPLLVVSPSIGPKPSSFFMVFATLATSPE